MACKPDKKAVLESYVVGRSGQFDLAIAISNDIGLIVGISFTIICICLIVPSRSSLAFVV